MRKKINKNWKFHKGDIEHAEGPEFNDALWEDIQIPHDYTIEGPFSKSLSRWNGYLPKGTGWYRKYIQLPDELSEKRIYLEFEGIFRKSNIWVNGGFAGSHRYGYTGKVLDVTDYIHTGSKPNLIAVKIDNSDYEGSLGGLAHIAGSIPDFPDEREASEGWWYEGCGIYRNVWLIAAPQIHIVPWGIFVTTPQVSEKNASISIQTTVQNSININTECVLETSIIDPHGYTVLVIKDECMLTALSKKVRYLRFSRQSRQPGIFYSGELFGNYSGSCSSQASGYDNRAWRRAPLCHHIWRCGGKTSMARQAP